MKKVPLIILCFSGFAFADPASYVDGNLGLNTSWGTVGFNVNGGAMVDKNLGFEGGITYSPGYRYMTQNSTSYYSDYWMLDVATKGVLPLNSKFSLFGKLGLAFNNYGAGCSGSYCSAGGYVGSNVGLLVAIGGQYHLSKNLALQLQDYTSTGSNPNFLSFGVHYSF